MTDGIPQLVHRIWLRDPMPAPVVQAGDRIRELHPGWELHDWTDPGELPDLVNWDIFDRARELCPRDWKRFESDLLRLEIIWQFGGVYLDTDVVVHRPLDELVEGRRCVVGRSPQQRHGHHAITNCVMAAVPYCPWIGRLVKDLPDAALRYGGKPLAQQIGPWHLDRIYGAEPWPTVTVLEPDEMFDSGLLTHGWNSAKRRRGTAAW